MQQDQPQIDQQQLGEKEYNIQQSHREENLPQETENHQPEEQQPQEEHHPQQPLEGQGPQQQGEPQLPPGPFDDQNEVPEPEPEEQVQPNEEEEEADGHQVEEEQPVEQAVEEQVEEGRSSNGPPEYNPDLIDDEDEEAATHPLIPDTQQLPEQGEFYMGEELIEPEGPSEVSHVYAQQEEIEWRDQEEPISSPHHDYHFQGIHEEEAIEHQPALLSTAAQVGSSLMKLEPLPAQAVQTVEEKAKPETVEQSASTDPPPKTVPAATQASKVESQQKTDIPSKMIKQEAVKSQVKPETSKAPQTSQIKQSVKSNTPKDSKPHPEQKPKETVKQSKVPSVQAPRQVQPVKKSETIRQSQASAIKTVSKTPSEQPPLKKQAEKAIQSKKTSQGKEQIKEQTTPKKDNPSSLLLLRNQKQVQREQQAEKQKIEQQQARKNELKEQTRLAKIEKERQELQRQRKEVEKAENERRQKQRQLMQQRQKQRERAQKERKDNQERERIAKQQQQRIRQKQQQNLHAQNVSQVSKASMDREEPQQALSSLPPPTIAKKKKKKKVSKQPQNKSAALPDAPQSPPTAPASKKPPNHDKESEQDRVSVVHSDIGQEEPRPVRNMVSEILMAEGGKPNKEGMVPVVLTSLMVVREAEKQRVGTTFRMFLKYNYQYERTVTAYKRIIVNVASQLQRKKAQKRPLQRILEDYFQDFAKIAKEFNDRCYKLQVQSAGEVPSKNPLASLRLQLKKGFDEMVFLRKSVANHNNRLALYINNTLLPQLRKAFEGYYAGIVAEETKQAARRDELIRKEKQLAKVISQTQRSFQRGLQGRFKEDLFIELSKFINEQKIHRATLRNYGRGLLDLRHAYMRSEKELFDRLQEQLLRFKQEWWAAYGERRVWREAEGLGERIKEATKFADLCTLVDLDYIKYVLELQSKQERDRFGSRDFQNYLDLVFFDRVVGNIRDLLKGATNKSFPLRAQGDELIHSISGNLVVFHRPSDLCRDHFRISNLNAKVVATGTVQFDELQKGILFDDSRTVRLQLKDDDRAEELICYLNEKEEDIVLPS